MKMFHGSAVASSLLVCVSERVCLCVRASAHASRMPRRAQYKCTCSIKEAPDVSISWISEEEYILPPLNLLKNKE